MAALLPIVLYVPFFMPQHIQRDGELLFALVNNLAVPQVTRVVLFVEERTLSHSSLFSHDKLYFAEPAPYARVNFTHVFDHIRRTAYEHIAIVANADIAFDSSLQQLSQIQSFGTAYLALSKWWEKEFLSDVGHLSNQARVSQDVWVFNASTVRRLVPPSVGHFYFGQLGCDNRLIAELKAAGLCAVNAAHSIITTHIHKSNRRTYLINHLPSTGGPYAYAKPTTLPVRGNGTLVCD